ncbi:hypothetical protein Tco_1160151 [Tanacetum coccineum]
MGLWYSKDTDMSMTAYANADHVWCQDTRRNTSGSAQFLGDKLVSWSSKKQKSLPSRVQRLNILPYLGVVLKSYGCVSQANKLWFSIQPRFSVLRQQGAIALCCNNVQHSRAKHIDVLYHFIKEQVENGIVELYFVWTEYQMDDIFTKLFPRERFNFLIEKLCMRSMSRKR